MPKLRALLLSAALLMLTATAQASVQAAEEAALAWLVKIDNSEYEQAWEAASPLLSTPLSAAMLERTVALSRKDFGSVQSRRQVRVSQYTSMPGAERGDFKVVTFQTQFANRPRVVEVVTPHQENGTWRVSGYYIE